MDDDRPPRSFFEWIGLRGSPDWSKARPLGVLVGAILTAFILLAVVSGIYVLTSVFREPAAAGATGNLGVGALIVAILGAPFVIWNTWIKHRALGFQKEGHITDRISKAVEQLGTEKTVKRRDRNGDGTPVLIDGKSVTIEETVPNIEVRVGALLSLERIAQDSTAYDKGRDHVRVMEIICTYIRENAPARSAKDHSFGEWEPLKNDATEEEHAAHLARREERFGKSRDHGRVRQWAQSLPPPRDDVALALRVLGRRTAEQRAAEACWGATAAPGARWVFDTPCPSLPDKPGDEPSQKAALDAFKSRLSGWQDTIGGYGGYRLDLRSTNLQQADLSRLVLSGARLEGARMEGADLGGARMEGADLGGARMEGADLRGARMEGAVLSGARMEGAFLRAARMKGADLWRARMEGADLGGARMEGAFLRAARMEGANLRGARMEGADLSGARMEGAVLIEARMDSRTILAAAKTQAAAASMMDFSSVPISEDQVNSMFGDGSVTLPGGVTPDHLDWPAHWPKQALDWHDFREQWRLWQSDPAAYKPPEPPAPAQ